MIYKLLTILLTFNLYFIYGFKEEKRLALRDEVKEMFNHAFSSYMKFGFPSDEVKPISCKKMDRDKNYRNIGVNDVLGNYKLTLVDSIDMLAVINDKEEFEKALKLIINEVSFDVDSRVQVFEVTIRMLGGLLSGHLLATDPILGFKQEWYNNELLNLAYDLGKRLLPAFYSSPTNIPFARVNLKYGMNTVETSETCLAGIGTLLLEFATLSRLTGDGRFEEAARSTLEDVWNMRFESGLFGNSINLRKGQWMYDMAGIGAGLDSFFEYLIKSGILFNDNSLMDKFESSYLSLLKLTRDSTGFFYLNVQANGTNLVNTWVDSLSAFFPGMQALAGDLDNAIKSHLTFYNIWRKFSAIPERFDIDTRLPVLKYYPLRPELIESTYMLYQATRDPFYLEVGERILKDLQKRFRVKCGFASMRDVTSGDLDDRMESFFLSETLKYLYLLFDKDNIFNKLDGNFVFNTEGHLFNLPRSALNLKDSKKKTDIPIWTQVCKKFKPNPLHYSSIRSRGDFHYIETLIGAPNSRKPHISHMGICSLPKVDFFEDFYKRHDKVLVNLLKEQYQDSIIYDERFLKSLVKVTIKSDKQKTTPLFEILGMRAQFGNFTKYLNSDITALDDFKGCQSFSKKQSKLVHGKILLLDRGECTFYKKATYAQSAGAIGIIYSSNLDKFFSPSYPDNMDSFKVEIPSILIQKKDGIKLKKLLELNDDVIIDFLPYSSSI